MVDRSNTPSIEEGSSSTSSRSIKKEDATGRPIEASNDDLEKKIITLFMEVEKINTKIEGAKDVENELRAAVDKVDNSQLKLIEILGFFVALFTFISSSIVISKNFSGLQATGYILILSGMLFIFISALHTIINYKHTSGRLSFNSLLDSLFAVGAVLIVIGIFIVSNDSSL